MRTKEGDCDDEKDIVGGFNAYTDYYFERLL